MTDSVEQVLKQPRGDSGDPPPPALPSDSLENATVAPFFEGFVDGVSDGVIRGWAWFPQHAGHRVVVEAVMHGAVVATTTAYRYRSDLESAGKHDGYYAFALPLQHLARTDASVSLHARHPDGSSIELFGSPLPSTMLSDTAATRTPDKPPIALCNAEFFGYLDTTSHSRIGGWIHRADGAPQRVSLAVYEGDQCLVTFDADLWRSDIADLQQGNGFCGFSVPTPESLRDGELHEIDICIAETRQPLTARPIRIRENKRAIAAQRTALAPIVRDAVAPEVDITFIVNFYNMRREAERTLTSLSRRYQRGIDDVTYEVLCIDNGSNPPLDQAWVESFGPEFKLFRPNQFLPSPCAAINEAARQARGAHLAIMIDGAHVLTPGVIREAIDAFSTDPQAIVAVRHWFIGGDQRWLSAVGYTREMEDKLFERIHWPADGYQMFFIGDPIGENPEPWLNALIESNCLFLPTGLYDRIGGMDEGFSEPGGGFANLDLLKRAASGMTGEIVSLIGEATFHQFHGGTTTNVDDDEKDFRVRTYQHNYRQLRGEEFQAIPRDRIRLRGRIHHDASVSVRQRPLLPLRLGITDRTRPGNIETHFDRGAQVYLQASYAESNLHQKTMWLGKPVGVSPADLVNFQEILRTERPQCIVTTCSEHGLILFLDSMLTMFGLVDSRIVVVADEPLHTQLPARAHLVVGDAYSSDTLSAIRGLIGADETSLVFFSPRKADFIPVEQLRAYAQFVSFRSYLIFLGSVFGQPWLGYSSYWFQSAINGFVASSAFVIDKTWNQHLISTSPNGYLRRVGDVGPFDAYDASLDNLDSQSGHAP